MLREFFQRRREQKAIREWHNSPLGRQLAAHTAKYFQIPRLAEMSEQGKKSLIEGFYREVAEVASAENQFLALREKLAALVCCYAELQILCLTDKEKPAMWYADDPYISGELHRHILKAAEHNNELKEIIWKHPDITAEELVSYCNSRCVVHLYYLNGFNIVRNEFKDGDEEKDWFRPFIRSMLIWEEHTMRGKLGLPDLLPNFLDGLKHSLFMNCVVNGEKNPFFAWEMAVENIEKESAADT